MSPSAFNPWTRGRKLKAAGAVLTALGASVGTYYGWGQGGPHGNTPAAVVASAPATATGTVTLSASTVPSTATSVTFKVDGTTTACTDSTGPTFSCSWDSTAASNAPHVITAVASDADGHAISSGTVQTQVSNTAPAPTGTANVWIDGNGGTCTRSASAAAYVDASACSSFRTAYAKASNGDTIGVVSGTYGAQTLAYKSTITSAVTFVPEAGSVTITGDVCFGQTSSTSCDKGSNADPASWVTLDGDFVITGSVQTNYRNRAANNLSFTGGHSARIGIISSSDVTFTDWTIGPNCCSSDGINVGPGVTLGSNPNPHNIVFDGLHMHDIDRECADYPGPSADGVGPATCPGDSIAHVDCVQYSGVDDTTIENSTFYNCATQGIFFGGTGPNPPPSDSRCPNTAGNSTAGACYSGDLLIENTAVSLLASGSGGRAFAVNPGSGADPSYAPDTTTLTVKNSSGFGFSDFGYTGAEFPPANVTLTNNLGTWTSSAACTPNSGITYTYAHNMFSGKTCGATDTLLASDPFTLGMWVDLRTDYHLTSGAAAIDAGDDATCTTTDFDGDVRPQGSHCDVGADEYVAP